jgi:hypothetical protein
VSRSLASLFAAAALFGAGGLFGAALSAGRDPARVPAAAASPQPPAEVRTVVKRRTVHVYRKPKRRPVAPAPTAAPVTLVPAPVRAAAPVAPAPTSHPLQTRTSGAAAGGHDDDHGEHESEGGDD